MNCHFDVDSGQPDADDLQMGRAIRAAKLRDIEATCKWGSHEEE